VRGSRQFPRSAPSLEREVKGNELLSVRITATASASFTTILAIMIHSFFSSQLRSNPLVDMLEPLNPDSWDGEGNLLVPLHGIRRALGMAFLSAVTFLWFTYLGQKVA
jgi:hypothetical protein